MNVRAAEIKALFDRIAPQYDGLNSWLSLGQHRIWKLMAVKWTEPKQGYVGLDLCCGSGDLALLLARQIGSGAARKAGKVMGKVIGVDFAPQQLAIARHRAAGYPALNLDWVEGDVLDLPFPDNHFDCATMGYGLRNVTDIPRCLAELHRVLKPGAKAAILDFHRPSDPQLRKFQQWYLDTIVVPAAQRFNLKEEYAYIGGSLERFPTGEEQVNLATAAGFSSAIHYPIVNGMMGVLVVTKSMNNKQ